jgi:hypothetical protein
MQKWSKNSETSHNIIVWIQKNPKKVSNDFEQLVLHIPHKSALIRWKWWKILNKPQIGIFRSTNVNPSALFFSKRRSVRSDGCQLFETLVLLCIPSMPHPHTHTTNPPPPSHPFSVSPSLPCLARLLPIRGTQATRRQGRPRLQYHELTPPKQRTTPLVPRASRVAVPVGGDLTGQKGRTSPDLP